MPRLLARLGLLMIVACGRERARGGLFIGDAGGCGSSSRAAVFLMSAVDLFIYLYQKVYAASFFFFNCRYRLFVYIVERGCA